MKILLLFAASFGLLALAAVSPNRHDHLSTMSKPKLIRMMKDAAGKPENREMSCLLCTLAVDGLQALLKENSTDNEIGQFLTNLCDFMNLEQPYVCKHMVTEFQDEGVFVFTHTLFTPDEICGAFVPDCGHSVNPLDDMWNLTLPDGKLPVKPWPTIPAGKPSYRFLHLSDIHIDRHYTVNSEAYCQADDFLGTYFMCCRNYTDDSDSHHRAHPIYVPAGPWGMPYACDIPYQTFDATMKHISKVHTDLDYIIITGDFESHDMWDYTEENTKNNLENVTNTLLKYFPKTPIYVSIGNHEGVPQDAMAPHNMPEYDQRGPQWIYTIMKDMVSHWIPTSALPDVQYRASYAVYPKPGLKLISLNTVYCSEFNFYLYLDQRDPDATLGWLIDQLADSESKGEKVHIISHIPPGDNYCLRGWSYNFFNIVKRYENTIAQQFYGHTHNDHFQVYYDPSDPNSRPFHFNWIAPSVTTFAYNNPSYRIYTVDGGYPGATYTVQEAETYSTDLEAANQKNQPPVYNLEYKFKEFYNMTDLSPQSFSDLSDRLWKDQNLFKHFMKFYYRNGHDNECYQDDKCRRDFVCKMKKARSYDESMCAQLQ